MSDNVDATVWEVNGHTIRVLHTGSKEEDETNVMPNFFDADFNVATATGFTRVWEGSMIFRDFVASNESGIDFKGKNCIELGSGCGMFGLNLAALGANVLLTDVNSVTKDSTAQNVVGNSKQGAEGKLPEGAFFVPSVEAYHVGDGTAAASPIDWYKPLSDVVKQGAKQMDYLIGCECVWVPDLLQPFADTMARVLAEAPEACRALVCYPVRGKKVDSYFTNRVQFEEACQKEGLVLTMLKFTPMDPAVKESLDTCIYSIALDRTFVR